MTRMERRRRNRRIAWIRMTVAALIVLAVVTASAAVDGMAEGREEIEPIAPVISVEYIEPKVETGPTDGLEECELIEAALVEQGYFNEEIPLEYDLQDQLVTVCGEYGVPLHIALGVIQAESSFTEDAINGSCYGYMQINSVNSSWLYEAIGVTDLKDPYQNIRSGVYMLGDLYSKQGDWHRALICYNYGTAGAQEHVFSKGLTTTTYSQTVMGYAAEWEVVLQ